MKFHEIENSLEVQYVKGVMYVYKAVKRKC